MRILGMDTATPQGSVALLDQDRTLAEVSIEPPAKNSHRILSLVDQVLAQAGVGLQGVDAFAVTQGPGSFTGLRVGVSLVQGLVLSTGKPFMGIDTLEAVAATVPETQTPICPVLDARKKEIYTAFFRYDEGRLVRTSPNVVIAPEAFCSEVTEPTLFLGSGLEPYGALFAERLGAKFMEAEAPPKETVAASAARLAQSGGFHKGEDLDRLTIQYIRKSEAEINYAKHQS